ncbi:disulfide bond formation protein B [Novosphingobium bradum]|uniref:Disulfide bond formation protein B n=1 Tax=Novosphingobium bradum TaxID=1737444 RepID=A0ABV7IR35_9SPHN
MLPRGAAARRYARLIALGLPAALLAGAYVSQYGFGLYPCEMCWWQRYAHFAALPFALLAFAAPRARWPVVLATLAIAASALIGAYHAGVEYHWWQGLTACTSTADTSLGNALDAIMNAPMIRCDQAQWTLFGVSLAGYNFLLSGAGALLAAVLLLRGREG